MSVVARRACPPGPADQLEQTVSSRRKSCSVSRPSGGAGAGRRVQAQRAADVQRRAAPAIASPLAVVTNATSTGSPSCVRPRPGARRRARRSARGSRTHTASTPRARAAATASSPFEPAPTTSSASPARSPARSKARSTQPSGSTNVPATGSSAPSASSSLTSGGAEPHLLGEPARVERGRAKLLAQRLVPAPAAPARRRTARGGG